jgi:hypothetical protein
MYTNSPEDYLQHRGMLVKPIESKFSIDEVSRQETAEKEHEMKLQDVQTMADIEEKQWKSCCFSLHQESSLFFAKLSVSLLVISLCSFQLINLKDCNYQSLYSSLLSSVITFWLNKK